MPAPTRARPRLTVERFEDRINPFIGGAVGTIVGASVPFVPGPTTAISWAYDAYEAVTGDTQARQEFNELVGQARGVLDVALGYLDLPSQLYMRANANKYLADWGETSVLPSYATDNTGEPVYYVNGIQTDRLNAEAEARALADQLAREVRLIYNGTSSIAGDLGESIKDKYWFPPLAQHNVTTREVAGMLDAARRAGERVNIVGHSQGAFIVNNAIRTLNAMGYGDYTFNSVAVVLTGASMTALEGAGTARYGRIDNPGDPFAEVLGTRSDSLVTKGNVYNGIGAQKHDFRQSYVAQVTDGYFFGSPSTRADGYEPNNSAGQATNLGTASPFNPLRRYFVPLNVLTAADTDWFTFRVATGSVLSDDDKVGIQFSHARGDLDLFLYRDPNAAAIRTSNGTGDTEQLNLNGLTAGTYYLKVVGHQGATGPYGFHYQISPRLIVDSSEPNNSYTRARTVNVGSLAGEAETSDGIQIDDGVIGLIPNQTVHHANDVDWYAFEFDNWVGVNSSASISFTGANGDLDMALYVVENGRLKQLQSSEGTGNSERVSFSYRGKGRYYVKVYGYEGATNNYTFRYTVSGAGLPTRGAEPANNSRTTTPGADRFSGIAAGLRYDPANFPQVVGLGGDSAGLSTPQTIHSTSDVDWYRLVLEDWGRTGDYWGVHNFRNEQGDIDIRLYDAGGNAIPGRSSTGTGPAEAVPLDGLAPGTYFVQVYGAGGAINWYTIGAEFEGMVEDAFEAAGGDAPDTAEWIGAAGGGSRLTGVREERSIHSTADDDYFAFDLTTTSAAGAYLALDFFMTDGGDTGDLDLVVTNAAGAVVRSATGTANTEAVDLAGLPPGRYAVRVYGARSTNYYAMRFDLPTDPVSTERGRRLTASGSGGGSVQVFDVANGQLGSPVATLAPFGPLNTTVRTANADVDGDGTADTVLVTGPGTPLRVAVVSGADNSTVLVAPFDPFGGNFAGGGYVAAADLDGDGKAEFVVTPDEGGGPRVTVFGRNPDGTTAVRANFLGIDDANFRGGARAALGDVNGDGRVDVIVAAGFGGGPRTAIFGGASVLAGAPARLVNDFFSFPGSDALTLRNGSFVAAGDVTGDGFSDLIFGGGPGGAPRVFILSGALVSAGDVAGAQAAPVGNFFVAGNTADRGGVRVAVKDTDGDTRADVVVGSGEGNAARVRVYLGASFASSPEAGSSQDLAVLDGAILAGGVFVG